MDSQNLLFSFIQAEEAKKHLESKLIEVEDNFVMQQAILGWIADNPWLFAFMLQREVNRRDVPVNGIAAREIELVRQNCGGTQVEFKSLADKLAMAEAENQRLLTELAAARAIPEKIWGSLKDEICPATVLVELLGDNNDEVSISGMKSLATIQASITKDSKNTAEFKEGFFIYLKSHFIKAGVEGNSLPDCPSATGNDAKKLPAKPGK